MPTRQSVQSRVLFLTVLILLAGMALRLARLSEGSLWWDELVTSDEAQGSLQDGIDALHVDGTQGPFYFLSLHIFPTPTDLLLRYPSVLLGLLAIALMIKLMRWLGQSQELALWCGVLLAFNPYHIWLSRTARSYALVVVLSLLILHLFLRVIVYSGGRTAWIGFALSSMIAYVTHYFLLGVVIVQFVFIVLYLRDDRRRFWGWTAVQVLAGLPMLGWMYFQSQQKALGIEVNWIPKPALADLPLTLAHMSAGYPLPPLPLGTLIAYALAAIALGAAVLALRRGVRAHPLPLYALLLTVIPIGGVWLVSVLVRPGYMDRYFALSAPGVIVLIAWGAWRLPRTAARMVLTLLILGALAGFGVELERGDITREDWRALTRDIARGVQPNDQVLVMAWERLVLRYEPDTLESYLWPPSGTPRREALLPPTDGTAWVVVRNPNEDPHRLINQPAFDPLDIADDQVSLWLAEHPERILARHDYNGLALFRVAPTEALFRIFQQ